MDAIALYSEWKSSPYKKQLADILKEPDSHGILDIKNIESGYIIGDPFRANDNCNLRFNKNGKTYEICLERIKAVHHYYDDGSRRPAMLSIQNKADSLVLLFYEEDETDAFLAIEFDSGSIKAEVNNHIVSCVF